MVIKPKGKQKIGITGSGKAHELVWAVFGLLPPFDRDKEHFWVIGLNRAMNVKFLDWVSMGTLHATVVEPREVFRNAILNGASSIILVHNHPSGQMEPSEQDKTTTKQMVEAGKLLRIPVTDHVIIGEEGYYSFVDNGML